MTLIDNKINVLYKLCRHIGDEQQENSRLISKLVAIDELSDEFWNVSFSNIFNFDLISLFNPSFKVIKKIYYTDLIQRSC